MIAAYGYALLAAVPLLIALAALALLNEPARRAERREIDEHDDTENQFGGTL
jgi:hypothetical protein